jgi:hypothetical protein
MTRIGLEDRIFVNVLGSMIIFLITFTVTQSIVIFFGNCTNMLWIRKIVKKCKTNVPARSLLIIFYLEAYIDLYIGGLINTENDWLFEVPGNWGFNGYLSWSD